MIDLELAWPAPKKFVILKMLLPEFTISGRVSFGLVIEIAYSFFLKYTLFLNHL